MEDLYVQVNIICVCAMQNYRWSGVTPPLIPNFRIRWKLVTAKLHLLANLSKGINSG